MAGLLLHNVDHIVDGKAVRLHPNRINDRIGADAPGHLDQRLADVGMPKIDGFCPQSARSEEHTSELQSLMRISYAVICLKKKKTRNRNKNNTDNKTKLI